MAGSILQNRPSERERDREVLRRPDDYNYGPFSIMRRISDEMDRAFGSWGLHRGGTESVWSPAVEVRERDGNLEVTAELPGLKKEDVKVECTEEGVIIQGERRQEREVKEGGYHRTERSYGHFYRMVPLPPGAEPDKAKAEFKDGLLQVRIPVPESKQKRREIPISA